MSESGAFTYVAMDAAGRRRSGAIQAADERTAFALLKREGLSPLVLRPAKAGAGSGRRARICVRGRRLAGLMHDIATLVGAGADLKSALTIIAARSPEPPVAAAARDLAGKVAGGAALDQAFQEVLGEEAAFVSGLIAAGEASGELAYAFSKAAALIETGEEIRAKLIGAVSYPAFVAIMAVAALGVILFAVVPSLEPLLNSATASPPLAIRVLFGLSHFLSGHVTLWVLLAAGSLVGGVVAWRAGLLATLADRLVIDGPVAATARQLVYGRFAVGLGELLSAGVPIAEGLRLAVRAIRSRSARDKLDVTAHDVRHGVQLSTALDRVGGFPKGIVHLAQIGEEAGSLAAMLERSGRIEIDRGLRRIEALAQWLGPVLIVLLGALIGLLMAGLLTGVSGLGEAALE